MGSYNLSCNCTVLLGLRFIDFIKPTAVKIVQFLASWIYFKSGFFFFFLLAPVFPKQTS